jgi:hypothetical protein
VNCFLFFFCTNGNEFVKEPKTCMTFNFLEELILYLRSMPRKKVGFGGGYKSGN